MIRLAREIKLGIRKEGTDVHGHMNTARGIRIFANRAVL